MGTSLAGITSPNVRTAGDEGQFSVIDLRDFNAPREAKLAASPAAGRNNILTSGAGHYWDNADPSGLAWHTGSGGAAAFRVADPLNPVVIATTNEQGVATPWNDFIHHNSMRPNGTGFVAGAAPNVKSGNVLLVTEEDYFNDGDEVVGDRAGPLQTWHVTSYAPGGLVPLDLINPVKVGDGLSGPVGGFCSAHWFWVPERNKHGIRTDRKSNVVYATDLVRGRDVLEVDLPR